MFGMQLPSCNCCEKSSGSSFQVVDSHTRILLGGFYLHVWPAHLQHMKKYFKVGKKRKARESKKTGTLLVCPT